MIRRSKLHEELVRAGIPIHGVIATGPSDPADPDLSPDVVIDYRSEATAQQRTGGQTIKAAHTTDTPLTNYLRGHVTNLRVFARAQIAIDSGIDAYVVGGTDVDRSNALGTALNNAVTILTEIPALQTALNKLRDVHGLPASVGVMTLAQRREWHKILGAWLAARLSVAAHVVARID